MIEDEGENMIEDEGERLNRLCYNELIQYVCR